MNCDCDCDTTYLHTRRSWALVYVYEAFLFFLCGVATYNNALWARHGYVSRTCQTRGRFARAVDEK
jgi:hypothetical protein